jgi:hypothetical protein
MAKTVLDVIAHNALSAITALVYSIIHAFSVKMV